MKGNHDLALVKYMCLATLHITLQEGIVLGANGLRPTITIHHGVLQAEDAHVVVHPVTSVSRNIVMCSLRHHVVGCCAALEVPSTALAPVVFLAEGF